MNAGDPYTSGCTYRVTGIVYRTEDATYRGHGWWQTADGGRYWVHPSLIVSVEVLVEPPPKEG